MQYIRHNFFTNFNNAARFQDSELIQDLLIDEIAKLCVFKKDEVAKILIGAGINIPKRPKSKYLSKQIIKNIDKDSLRKNLIKLIYANNEKSKPSLPKNARSRRELEQYLIKYMKAEAGSLNKYLFVSFNSDNDNETENTNVENLTDKVSEKVNTHNNNKNTIDKQIRPINSKQLMYIAGGIWIIGIAITQLTVWVFKKYEAKKFAEGGEIGDNIEQPPENADINIKGENTEQPQQVSANDIQATKGEFGANNIPEQPIAGAGNPQLDLPEPDLDLRKHINNN